MQACNPEQVTYEKIVFCDGSTYVGTLKGMQPDGLGTCTWKDGNQYDGEWKAGAMHGFGTYIWTSGQRYDGEWKDGRREGIGVKRYADGSTFDGFWKDGKKHGVGVFRPAQAPQQVHGKANSGQPSKRMETLRSSLSLPRGQQVESQQQPQPQPRQQQHWLSKQQQQQHQQQQQQQQPGRHGKDGGAASLSSSPDCKPFLAGAQQVPIGSRQTSGGLLLPSEWQLPEYAEVCLGEEGGAALGLQASTPPTESGSSPPQPRSMQNGSTWSLDESPDQARPQAPRGTAESWPEVLPLAWQPPGGGLLRERGRQGGGNNSIAGGGSSGGDGEGGGEGRATGQKQSPQPLPQEELPRAGACEGGAHKESAGLPAQPLATLAGPKSGTPAAAVGQPGAAGGVDSEVGEPQGPAGSAGAGADSEGLPPSDAALCGLSGPLGSAIYAGEAELLHSTPLHAASAAAAAGAAGGLEGGRHAAPMLYAVDEANDSAARGGGCGGGGSHAPEFSFDSDRGAGMLTPTSPFLLMPAPNLPFPPPPAIHLLPPRQPLQHPQTPQMPQTHPLQQQDSPPTSPLSHRGSAAVPPTAHGHALSACWSVGDTPHTSHVCSRTLPFTLSGSPAATGAHMRPDTAGGGPQPWRLPAAAGPRHHHHHSHIPLLPNLQHAQPQAQDGPSPPHTHAPRQDQPESPGHGASARRPARPFPPLQAPPASMPADASPQGELPPACLGSQHHAHEPHQQQGVRQGSGKHSRRSPDRWDERNGSLGRGSHGCGEQAAQQGGQQRDGMGAAGGGLAGEAAGLAAQEGRGEEETGGQEKRQQKVERFSSPVCFEASGWGTSQSERYVHTVTEDAVAALEAQQLRQHVSAHDLGVGLRRYRQPSRVGNTDSVLTGPPPAGQADGKVLYIRRFKEGKLEREDRFTYEEMKEIFQDVWTKHKKGEPRTKAIGRHMKKALGIGKKLEEKQGQLIYKGMPGYDLMIRLQLGIRYSIGRVNQVPVVPMATTLPTGAVTTVPQAVEVPLTEEDFKHKAKVFFPMAGSSTTPAHPSSDFKWKDYCPRVFRRLRAAWGINDAEYMLSLGGSQALRQLNSPGKSGCMFFLSDDERFLIKTMRKNELKTLVEMLPMYYKHMESHPQSLVTHFFGVHGVKEVHGRTVRFMVMSNIFCTELQIDKKFDLKGSTFERTAGAANPNDPKSIFKDLDLDVNFKLPKELHDRLGQQFGADAAFLQAVGVMDYSLLLGVHFCSRKRPVEGGLVSAMSGRQDRHLQAGLDRQTSIDSFKPGRESDVGSVVGRGVSAAAPAGSPATPFQQDMPQALGQGHPAGLPHPPHPPHPYHRHSHSRASSGIPSVGTPARPMPASANTTPGKPGLQAAGLHAAAGAGKVSLPVNGGVLRPVHTRRWQSDSVTDSTGTTAHAVDHQGQYTQLQGPVQETASHGGRSLYTPRPTYDGGGIEAGSDWSVPPPATKNFDIFSNREELSMQLAAVEARMRRLKYSEQRIQDVLGLAKLKILGDKLNKRDRKRHRGQHTQSRAAGVVKALAQARQETDAEENGTATAPLPMACSPPSPFMQATAAATAAGPGGMSTYGSKGAAWPWQGAGEERLSGGGYRHPPFTLMLGPDMDSASGTDSDNDGIMTRDHNGSLPAASSMLHSHAVSMVCQHTQLGFNMPAVATHHPPLHVLEQRNKSSFWGLKSREVSRSARDSLSIDEALSQGKRPQQELQFGCFGGALWASHPHAAAKQAHEDEHKEHGGARMQAPLGESTSLKGGLGTGFVVGEGEEEVLLYFGIIDILQEYNTRKLLERGMKSLVHDKHSISVAPPTVYASRFMDFIHKQVFTQPLLDQQSPLHALALSASLMHTPLPLPLPHGQGEPALHHACQAQQQGCYNYFIAAMGQRLDQQALGWGSADTDALEDVEQGAHPQPSLCLPSTLPEEQTPQASTSVHAAETATEDVRIEVLA